MKETEIDTEFLKEFIYISIKAKTFSIVDVYPYFEDLNQLENIERLTLDNLVNRVI